MGECNELKSTGLNAESYRSFHAISAPCVFVVLTNSPSITIEFTETMPQTAETLRESWYLWNAGVVSSKPRKKFLSFRATLIQRRTGNREVIVYMYRRPSIFKVALYIQAGKYHLKFLFYFYIIFRLNAGKRLYVVFVLSEWLLLPYWYKILCNQREFTQGTLEAEIKLIECWQWAFDFREARATS